MNLRRNRPSLRTSNLGPFAGLLCRQPLSRAFGAARRGFAKKTCDEVLSGSAGFTLAEVLAALMFMAIVIPVAVQGLRIANLSGEVAVRKAEAARVAERVLNESIITTNWNRSTPSGVAMEGTHQFRYQLRSGPWLQEPMRVLSVQVTFGVQGQNYNVLLSTLVDSSPPQ